MYFKTIKHKDWRARMNAVKWLEDNKTLNKVAKSDPDWHVRFAAVERIGDESILISIAKNDADPDVRIRCDREKIESKDVLNEIYYAECDKRVKKVLASKLDKICRVM